MRVYKEKPCYKCKKIFKPKGRYWICIDCLPNCEWCGIKLNYSRHSLTVKTCGRSCQAKASLEKRIGRKPLQESDYPNCKQCNKQIRNSHARSQIFCSRICSSKWNYKNSQKINGALKKSHLGGKNNPRWQGGKTDPRKQLQNSKKHKEWRIAIFKRDNYTCQMCGQIGHELNADHIYSWKHYPEKFYDLDNGRTLCISCHRKTPNYGSKAWNYKRPLKKAS